ncbi:hypothetical protein [Microbacterium sp. SLBN-111]|uniref:AraC-like ligand-binding domain-containing protein n=1 Tax=Microbacterium sp. SLBN-111 TaxID=3377733 RepID=UPI003C77F5F7
MGEAAAQNCDDFGWGPLGPVDPTLVAETAQSRLYGHGRAWSRSSRYVLRGDAQSLHLVLTVEGGFEFTVDGQTMTADPGQLVFFDGRLPTTARTLRETARYVWFLRPSVLQARRAAFRLHEPVDMMNAPMQSLVSMTNALLNAENPATASAQDHFGAAAEHLIAAALEESPRPTDPYAMHRDGLFTAAQNVIEAHFRNPAFGAREMSRELATSMSHMYAVFAAMGTTPKREIERRRLAAIEAAQRNLPRLDELVQESGFISVRQYRAALARSRHRLQTIFAPPSARDA